MDSTKEFVEDVNIYQENSLLEELLDYIKSNVYAFLSKFPNITPSIRYKVLKKVLEITVRTIFDKNINYRKAIVDVQENIQVILNYNSLEPIINKALVSSDIYKLSNMDDKLNLLFQDDPDFAEDILRLNEKCALWHNLNKKPMKKIISEEINNLYERKYKFEDEDRKHKNLSKMEFLKRIYPFLEHHQPDWDEKKFLNYTKN